MSETVTQSTPPKKTKTRINRKRFIPAVLVLMLLAGGLFLGLNAVIGWWAPKEPPETFARIRHEVAIATTGPWWCEQVVRNLPEAKDSITPIGGYEPSKATVDQLNKLINETTKHDGHDIGFVMMDLSNGRGLVYNTGKSFYGASSIKVHRIFALANIHPEVVTKYKQDIKDILVDSDNSSYDMLYRAYGNEELNDWVDQAGASIEYNPSRQYAYYSTASLAKLWYLGYEYMNEGNEGETIGKWAEAPEISALQHVLNETYTIRSKAGWIAEDGYYAAVDGGIVYDPQSPYLLVIMSNYPANVEALEPYVDALEQAHQEAKIQGLGWPFDEVMKLRNAEAAAEGEE